MRVELTTPPVESGVGMPVHLPDLIFPQASATPSHWLAASPLTERGERFDTGMQVTLSLWGFTSTSTPSMRFHPQRLSKDVQVQVLPPGLTVG
jgi:hypothetical protein